MRNETIGTEAISTKVISTEATSTEKKKIKKKWFQKTARFLAMLSVIAVVCALTGCQSETGNSREERTDGEISDASQESAKGRFLESEIELPDEADSLLTIAALADGSLKAVGYNDNLDYCLLSSVNQGESFEVSALNDVQASYIMSAAIAPDGEVALAGFFTDEGAARRTGMKIITDTGEIRTVPIQLPDYQGKDGSDTENMILEAMYDEAGTLFICDMTNTIFRVDTGTGVLSEFAGQLRGDVSYFGIAGTTVLVCDGFGLICFDSQSGERLSDDEVLQDMMSGAEYYSSAVIGAYPVVFTKGADEGSILYANNQGIFYHQRMGSINEQLVSGELTSLVDTGMALQSLIMLDEKQFLLLAIDSLGATRLYDYVYDANASAKPERQLRIYALEDSQALQQAVSFYQKQHPDVFVKKLIGMSAEYGITAEDALKSLNTDILAGNGPDILILDGMPMESYLEKGILADISGLVGEVDERDGIWENIRSAYEKEDGLYEMPARFYFSVVAGDQNAIAAAGHSDTFVEYVRECTGQQMKAGVLYPMSAGAVLRELYAAEGSGFKNADGEPDEGKLRAFLTAAKELCDMGGYAAQDSEPDAYHISADTGAMYGVISGALTGTIGIYSIGMLTQDNQVAFGTLSDINGLQFLHAVCSATGGSFDRFLSGETAAFVPYCSVGMLKESAQNEDACEFIRQILGKEGQRQIRYGFPVNQSAFEILSEQQTAYSMAASGEGGTLVELDAEKLTDAQLDDLKEMIQALSDPVATDRVIMELIFDEGEKYVTGQHTLEESMTTILQKVTLYLSE
ncbi:MAG: hypothetical protein IJ711_09305 [Lachnospiraceae bacterium]|nr:hypothetical protein [Lachnospiraceae bacterium]